MKNRIPKQPPIDNRYVAAGCEPFASLPLADGQLSDGQVADLLKEMPRPDSLKGVLTLRAWALAIAESRNLAARS